MLMKGTKFQLKVWKYLKTIPKGKVKTYKQVAIGINRPKAARAVANACAKIRINWTYSSYWNIYDNELLA